MDAAHAAGIPVVVVQLHEEVAKRPASLHVNKRYASVFTGTGLAEWFAEGGVDALTVVGYMTHNCDAATIYEAAHKGWSVEFLADGRALERDNIYLSVQRAQGAAAAR